MCGQLQLDIIRMIITNILNAVYQPFWFATVLSVVFMYAYRKSDGLKHAVKEWISWFRSSRAFRRMFFLVFYVALILFRTLLNRNMWMNPLSNVFGYWGLHNDEGMLITECIENFLLFIPFTILLFSNFRDRLLGSADDNGGIKFTKTVWVSLKITFVFSFIIEFLQLIFMLGTWQLSDLVYNTLGGVVGGIIFFLCCKIRRR